MRCLKPLWRRDALRLGAVAYGGKHSCRRAASPVAYGGSYLAPASKTGFLANIEG